MKLDMKKAFNRMEWPFLIKILNAMGFGENFQRLIYSSIKRVEYSLLLNGNISKRIKLGRGLRQGNPLSPILFIIGSEVLSRLLNREEMLGNLYRIKVDRSGPAISHLMYTDNLVMRRVDKKEAEIFKRCFDKYCSQSRQKANLDKSNVLFSKNSPRSRNKDVLEITGFKAMGLMQFIWVTPW